MNSKIKDRIRPARDFLKEDEALELSNPHLDLTNKKFELYHLGLTLEDAPRFTHVKRVITGGTAKRAKTIAQRLQEEFHPDSSTELKAIGSTDRFSMYLVGDSIVISHGMGLGSIEIMLNEISILLAAAKAQGVKFYRVGTSGGIGEDPGTVIISNRGWSDRPSEDLQVEGSYFPKSVCGKQEWWPSGADPMLIQEILEANQDNPTPIKVGGTMAKSTFYGAEARIDGAICDHSTEEATEFFLEARNLGILNSEMEAGEFLALTNRLGIRAAIICVVLDNCFTHESINFKPEQHKDFSRRAIDVLFNHIRREKA